MVTDYEQSDFEKFTTQEDAMYDGTNAVQAVCSGCKKESNDYYHPITFHYWARTDYNGLFTGLYCDKCYNNQEKYPYRKDDYNQDAIENGENIWGDE